MVTSQQVQGFEPFDLAGPLPRGTTLLEASAGTGKTYTVAALVTRYIAEGHATLDQLLVITFGRAATNELRERVREHLVAAEADATDAVVKQRLRDALAGFDTATIATTHQFCQIVLRSLGVAGDSDPETRLVESVDELVIDIVDDLYLRWYGELDGPPAISRATALTVSRAAVADPRAWLAPAGEEPRGQARVAFASAVRQELELRKRRLGVLSYDDLLARLADALEAEDSPARTRMRERWRIVLVDEFQDTDPVQWAVLDRAFNGHSDLILIGDPKQAIYGFRGGDVATYLAAARTATSRATLDMNWRSDADLVRMLSVPLESAQLGDPAISVLPVTAAVEGTRLSGAGAPWRLRQVRRGKFSLKSGAIGAGDARAHIARDCAADIARQLTSGVTFRDNSTGRELPLEAGQIAVIVAKHDQGRLIQRELVARGVPAVVGGGGDVFHTEAAEAWLVLLEALEAPHRTNLVRAAALTPFFGLRIVDFAPNPAEHDVAAGERLTARIADTLRGWGILGRTRGVAALVEAAEERGLTSRLLAVQGGDRLLTDVRHIGQLFHDLQARQGVGLSAILEWFRRERELGGSSERPRRLESDAAAVQIVTIWGSKGLQYPVVYLPFGSDKWISDRAETVRFHSQQDDGAPARSLDVSGAGQHREEWLREELGEEMRNLYVALTRAQSQLVTWWAPTANTPHSGLHRLLFGRRPGTPQVPDRIEVRDDDSAASILTQITDLGGPVREDSLVSADTVPPPDVTGAALEARTFDRRIDWEWRRTSYSGLIREAETAVASTVATGADGVTSEPEPAGLKDDESRSADPTDLLPGTDEMNTKSELAEASLAQQSPMAELPAGAAFGSLVHGVLEVADPEAPDFEAELRRHVQDQVRWWPVEVVPDQLAAGLVPLNQTPLGPLAGELSLLQIPLRDRLRELDFEIPLAGGDLVGREVWVRDLAPLLRAHLPADDPLVSYADHLESPALGGQLLRGYLTGSIDAVLRIPDPEVGHRYVIVDYKTNFLGPALSDYTPSQLAAAMLHSHYPLQAILYAVVVHRFLGLRVPDYDPLRHLGGVLYLYVRGMAGEQTLVVEGGPTGVFSWAPPAALVVALSDLIEGASHE